jgi:hypothetical protein
MVNGHSFRKTEYMTGIEKERASQHLKRTTSVSHRGRHTQHAVCSFSFQSRAGRRLLSSLS